MQMDADKQIFVEFTSARVSGTADERTYDPIGPICVSQSSLVAFYDHTLIMGSNQIRVMETYDEIKNRLYGRLY